MASSWALNRWLMAIIHKLISFAAICLGHSFCVLQKSLFPLSTFQPDYLHINLVLFNNTLLANLSNMIKMPKGKFVFSLQSADRLVQFFLKEHDYTDQRTDKTSNTYDHIKFMIKANQTNLIFVLLQGKCS